ncbi:45678_t:CDS:2, partial [Gigaspora margarita]
FLHDNTYTLTVLDMHQEFWLYKEEGAYIQTILEDNVTSTFVPLLPGYCSYIKSSGEISIPNLLGLTVIQNINYLQQKISKRVKKHGQKLVKNLNSTNLVKAELLYSSNGMSCDPISFQELAIGLKENRT